MRNVKKVLMTLAVLAFAFMLPGPRGTAYAETFSGEEMDTAEEPSLKDAKVVLSRKIFTYSGSVQKPSITSVTVGGEALLEGTDYDVIWQNASSTNAKTYKLKLAGKGRYALSSLIVKYRIDPANIDWKKLTLSENAFVYNGKMQRPSVTAVGGKKLKSGRDYTVTWYDEASTNAGTYYVRVVGKGNYTGMSAVGKYMIKKASIQDTKLVLSETTFAYNGKVQRPTVVSVGGIKLTEGTDYRITWSKKASTLPGTYKLKVTGIGSYKGSSTVETYEIVMRENTLTVEGKTAYASAEKLSRKNLTLRLAKVLDISRAKGIVTFEKVAGNDDFSVDEVLGNITMAKGLEIGTYELEITVTAGGNNYYKPAAKTVTVEIIVR